MDHFTKTGSGQT
jgi:hypothetical protein